MLLTVSHLHSVSVTVAVFKSHVTVISQFAVCSGINSSPKMG